MFKRRDERDLNINLMCNLKSDEETVFFCHLSEYFLLPYVVSSKSFGTFEIARQHVLAVLGKLCCLVECCPAMISHHPKAICSHACRLCLVIFKMADIHEQRINIKLCFKVG
jgi:hypothetical protein